MPVLASDVLLDGVDDGWVQHVVVAHPGEDGVKPLRGVCGQELVAGFGAETVVHGRFAETDPFAGAGDVGEAGPLLAGFFRSVSDFAEQGQPGVEAPGKFTGVVFEPARGVLESAAGVEGAAGIRVRLAEQAVGPGGGAEDAAACAAHVGRGAGDLAFQTGLRARPGALEVVGALHRGAVVVGGGE